MAYTKRDIVNQAFEEIGLASYVFDLQPQQLESALRRLDNMMATWNGKGIRLGYPLPSSPADSDLDQVTGVPDSALEAMATNLAVRIAPMFGKTVSPDTKTIAKKGLHADHYAVCHANRNAGGQHCYPCGRRQQALPRPTRPVLA